jgi:amidohydrolase
MPHRNIDPVVITSHIITALQQVVSRMAEPDMPTVLSFGRIIADGATNVIPDKVKIEGTFRTTDEQWRYQAHEKMKNMAEQMAVSMGGSCHFDIHKGYPTLVNDERLTGNAKTWAEEYLGKHNVVDLDMWFASEDFAYYSQVLPGCFYRLGTRNEARGIISPVHTSTFDIDERALEIGIGLMSWITVNQLAEKKGRKKKAH